jgi:hypothetical protein
VAATCGGGSQGGCDCRCGTHGRCAPVIASRALAKQRAFHAVMQASWADTRWRRTSHCSPSLRSATPLLRGYRTPQVR